MLIVIDFLIVVFNWALFFFFFVCVFSAIDSVTKLAMESADTLLEEQKLMAEAKYRQYMTNIDKALRNFEYSSEWADLIAALGKLSKVCC